MSLDDLKKLPLVDNPQTAPLIEIAEIETTKDWYDTKKCNRFLVYVKGFYSHPQIDSGKPHLIIVHNLTEIGGRQSAGYTTEPLENIVGYTPLKSL